MRQGSGIGWWDRGFGFLHKALSWAMSSMKAKRVSINILLHKNVYISRKQLK